MIATMTHEARCKYSYIGCLWARILLITTIFFAPSYLFAKQFPDRLLSPAALGTLAASEAYTNWLFSEPDPKKFWTAILTKPFFEMGLWSVDAVKNATESFLKDLPEEASTDLTTTLNFITEMEPTIGFSCNGFDTSITVAPLLRGLSNRINELQRGPQSDIQQGAQAGSLYIDQISFIRETVMDLADLYDADPAARVYIDEGIAQFVNNTQFSDSLNTIISKNPLLLENNEILKQLYDKWQQNPTEDIVVDVDETVQALLNETVNPAVKKILEGIEESNQELSDIKNLFTDKAAKERAAQKLREQRQKDVKLIQSAQGAVSLVAMIVGLSDKQAAQRVSVIGNASLGVVDAISRFNAEVLTTGDPLAISLGAAALTGNMIGALFQVFELFGEDQPKPEQLILDQITSLRQELQTVRGEMHARFDHVDAQLAAIWGQLGSIVQKLEWSHEEIRARLNDIEEDIGVLQHQVQTMYRHLQDLITEKFWLDFKLELEGSLAYCSKAAACMPYENFNGTDGAEAAVQEWVDNLTGTNLAGKNYLLRWYDWDNVISELSGDPLDRNVNYLSYFPLQSDSLLPHFSPVYSALYDTDSARMPSLAAWFVTANAHLQLTDEWPIFAARGSRSSDLTQDIIATGTVYRDWLETLSTPGEGDLLFRDLLDAYGQNWNGDKQARVAADRELDGQVSREIANVENGYLEGQDLRKDFPDGQKVAIDLWAGSEQPFDYLPELETINFCSPPIAIKTYSGHYLKAIDGGGRVDNTVDSDGTWQGAWEQFRLLDLGDGTHAIQTYNGTFLTAVDGGGRVTDELHTDATHIDIWEKFRLVHLRGNQYAIKTWSGHYVTAVDGGGRSDNAIDTNRTAIGLWETFTFEDVSNAQQLGLQLSKEVLAAFGVPDLFRLAHHLNEEELTAYVERIEPTHERTELAWQVYPIAEYHKYVKPAITLRIQNKDGEVVSVRRITSTNEIWMLAWRQDKNNWLSLEGVLNLWMWVRDNWTQGDNVRAQFETKSVDVPLTAEQAARLENLRPTVAQHVYDKLENHIDTLYSSVVKEANDDHSDLFAALNRVSGIKALLTSYALIGLPRSLEENEYLRALLLGDDTLRLLDAELIKTRYKLATRHNLALTKPASQSSDYGGATADLAVDQDTSRDFNWGSVTHTNADSPSWWQVDLQGEATLDRIELFNRSDCCGERLKDFDIFACQDKECEMRQSIAYVEAPVGLNPDPTQADLVVEANGTSARYLRIQLRQSDFLSLAEVRVMGRMASAYPNMRAQLNEDAEQRLDDLRAQLLGDDGAFKTIENGEVVEGDFALNATLAALDFRRQTLLSLATSDYYSLESDEDLIVGKIDGLLRNDSTQCAEQFCSVCTGDCDEPDVCLTSDGSRNRQTATAQLESGPSHGTLILDADGGFRYTPETGFQGFDGFSYRAVYSSDLGQPVTSDPAGVVIEVVATDSDEDGIPDNWEQMYFGSLDRDGTGDADDDGLSDALEYEQGTDPINDDTDGDGIQDGTELGYTLDEIRPDTDINIFIPDADDTTVTDPLSSDTDGDGLTDGQEDLNHNGRVDQGESDPNVMSISIYVDETATGNNDGRSWENAVNTIQVGIDLAKNFQSGRVHVAQGIYVENIISGPGIELLGGYPSGGGERDINRYTTVIDGSSNGHTVVIETGDGIIIDGFTITGGNATGLYPENRGGGIYIYGDRNSPVIKNCTIMDNIAEYGGGIYLGHTSPYISHCRILNNTASIDGGGIYYMAEYSYPGIINCLISKNKAGNRGGGIHSGDYSHITNATIVNNSAAEGGGIYSHPVYTPTIENTIFWNNSLEQIAGGSPSISYSCIQDGYAGEGNISNDPDFEPDGYHLKPGSLCIDAGINTASSIPEVDIDYDERILNDTIDMGVDEYNSASLVFFLPFEDNNAGTTTDKSGNGNDGAVNGANFIEAEGLGKSNAYEFSWASANHIEVPYQESQTITETLSLEAWIYPTAWDNIYAGYNRIISKQPVYLLRGANGQAHFQILTENSGYLGVYGDALTLNQWHYLVGTFDGQSIKLYVDGDLKGTNNLPQPDVISTNERSIHVGESPLLNEGFTGIIDNVAVYKIAKSQEAIKASWAEMSDDDTDGVPSNEEMGANGDNPDYDGNVDGVPDSQQDNAASLHTHDLQSYVTISTPTETKLSNVRAIENPSPADVPSDLEFPIGFFEFEINGIGVGGAATVNVLVPDGITMDTYYKFGPTLDNPTSHWYEFLYDGITGAEIDGQNISLHFVDGKRGDDDITANGTIVEPGAPGIYAGVPEDRDKDGVPDETDNCPDVVNPDQADGNGNGIGDVCEEVEPLLGDLDANNCVDKGDYTILMNCLRQPGSFKDSYDLNLDGKISIADARTLIGLFTNPGGAACE